MPITQILLTAAAQGGGGGGPAADFTVEWWQKVENNGQNARPWSVGLYPIQKLAVSYEGLINDYFWINDSYIGSTARNHVTGTWEHMALVRQNSVFKAYINGVSYFSIGNDNLITASDIPLYVGTGELSAGMYRGYLTDLHIIKGTAKYTDGNTFTPPILPLELDANSVFLLAPLGAGSGQEIAQARAPTTVTGTVTWGSSETPYQAINVSAPAFNVPLSILYIPKVSYPGLNANLIGYTFTSDNYTGDVVNYSNDVTYHVVTLNVTAGVMDSGTGTFTRTTNSYYFDGTSYFDYGASIDWAMDV